MIIHKTLLPAMTLEEFADKHSLIMRVHERNLKITIQGAEPFYAHFVMSESGYSVDVVSPGFLTGVSGDGQTPEDAIHAYAKRISLETLRIRGENVQAPRFTLAAEALR